MMDWIQSFYDALAEYSEKPSLTDWVQAASAALIVVLTLFQACINRRMWKVSQRQARDLKDSVVATRQSAEAAIAALRPWIPYPEMKVVDGLTYGDEGASFCIEITVKNTGKSPATNVHIGYELWVASAKPGVDVRQ